MFTLSFHFFSAMDAVLSVAHRHFSDTFAFLFETFCLLIGEEQKVLYAFFLMIEMICLSRDRYEFLLI